VRLREAERLGHLGLGSLEEEPLENDAALARVEGTRGPRDQRPVEAQLLERRRTVHGRVVVEHRRADETGVGARRAHDRSEVAYMA
jgi:hypothetical protein